VGVRESICPHCGKNKFSVEFSKDGSLKKIKGASWYPLLRQVGDREWREDWTEGIGMKCKCGRVFFTYGLENSKNPIQVTTKMRENNMLAWFCEKCGSAFIDSSMKCPFCGTQY
jgi:RNA polymerase subunit RPABC4/transcription elongation factor Spt4